MKTVLRQIAAHLCADDHAPRPDSRLAAQLAAIDNGALTDLRHG